LKFFDGKGGDPITYGYDRPWTLEGLSEFITEQTGIRPGARTSVSTNGSSPPPVPVSSRPNLAELQKSKPKPGVNGAPTGVCLKCRDFSGPDSHAARFPRQSIPSQDINWLAHQLCDPFPSATDKARVIFTWLHHNIEYNTVAFYSGNIKPSTPNSTLSSGLAVCEGYAALFTSLATAIGLESVVVGGHGKGTTH
jgi:transglutaminase/protease-like cytokinesis protein 3